MEARPHPQVNKWLVALTVMLPTFIEILDTTVVNVSLNHMQGSLSAGLDEVTWVLTSYLVSNAIVIPLSGWLSGLMGRKRYMLVSVILFTVSSFMCGASTSLAMLVAFRVLQGVGGGGLQPVSGAILLETFPKEEYGTAMAVYGMGVVFAPILGPILGGWITDNWNWRWIFYLNVPVGLISVIMTTLFIHDPPYIGFASKKIDYWGLILLVVGIGSLQVVLDRGERLDWFDSDFIYWFSLVSAVAIVLFVARELSTTDPVVDLTVFKDRSFALGNLTMFCGFFAFFASMVLLPIYVQKLMGYTSWWAGLVLAPGGVASLFMMPIAGKLIRRADPRILLLGGLGVNALALYLMSHFNLEADFHSIMLPRLIQGIGLAFFFVPLAAVTMAYIPVEKMGNASGLFNLIRNLAGSFGVAFITTQLARRAQFHHHVLAEHMNPYNPSYIFSLGRIRDLLGARFGLDPSTSLHAAQGAVYGELNRQAFMLSFNDAFFLGSLFFVAVLPLAVIVRRPRGSASALPTEA